MVMSNLFKAFDYKLNAYKIALKNAEAQEVRDTRKEASVLTRVYLNSLAVKEAKEVFSQNLRLAERDWSDIQDYMDDIACASYMKACMDKGISCKISPRRVENMEHGNAVFIGVLKDAYEKVSGRKVSEIKHYARKKLVIASIDDIELANKVPQSLREIDLKIKDLIEKEVIDIDIMSLEGEVVDSWNNTPDEVKVAEIESARKTLTYQLKLECARIRKRKELKKAKDAAKKEREEKLLRRLDGVREHLVHRVATLSQLKYKALDMEVSNAPERALQNVAKQMADLETKILKLKRVLVKVAHELNVEDIVSFVEDRLIVIEADAKSQNLRRKETEIDARFGYLGRAIAKARKADILETPTREELSKEVEEGKANLKASIELLNEKFGTNIDFETKVAELEKAANERLAKVRNEELLTLRLVAETKMHFSKMLRVQNPVTKRQEAINNFLALSSKELKSLDLDSYNFMVLEDFETVKRTNRLAKKAMSKIKTELNKALAEIGEEEIDFTPIKTAMDKVSERSVLKKGSMIPAELEELLVGDKYDHMATIRTYTVTSYGHDKAVEEKLSDEELDEIMSIDLDDISFDDISKEAENSNTEKKAFTVRVRGGYLGVPNTIFLRNFKEKHGCNEDIKQVAFGETSEWNGPSRKSGYQSLLGPDRRQDYVMNDIIFVLLEELINDPDCDVRIFEDTIKESGVFVCEDKLYVNNSHNREALKGKDFKAYRMVGATNSGNKKGSLIFVTSDSYNEALAELKEEEADKDVTLKFLDSMALNSNIENSGAWAIYNNNIAADGLKESHLRKLFVRHNAGSMAGGTNPGSIDLKKNSVLIFHKGLKNCSDWVDFEDLKKKLSKKDMKVLEEVLDGQAMISAQFLADLLNTYFDVDNITEGTILRGGFQLRGTGLQIKSFTRTKTKEMMKLLVRIIKEVFEEGKDFTIIGQGETVFITDKNAAKVFYPAPTDGSYVARKDVPVEEMQYSNDLQEIRLVIMMGSEISGTSANVSAQLINKLDDEKLFGKFVAAMSDKAIENVKTSVKEKITNLYSQPMKPFEPLATVAGKGVGEKGKYLSIVHRDLAHSAVSMISPILNKAKVEIKGTNLAIAMEELPVISEALFPHVLDVDKKGNFEIYSQNAIKNRRKLLVENPDGEVIVIKYPSAGPDEYVMGKLVSSTEVRVRIAMFYMVKATLGEISMAEAAELMEEVLVNYLNDGYGTALFGDFNILGSKLAGLDKDFDHIVLITEKAVVDIFREQRIIRNGGEFNNGITVMINNSSNINRTMLSREAALRHPGKIFEVAQKSARVGSEVGIIVNGFDAVITILLDKMFDKKGEATKYGLNMFKNVFMFKGTKDNHKAYDESIFPTEVAYFGRGAYQIKTLLVGVGLKEVKEFAKVKETMWAPNKDEFLKYLFGMTICARFESEMELDGYELLEMNELIKVSSRLSKFLAKEGNRVSNESRFLSTLCNSNKEDFFMGFGSADNDSELSKYLLTNALPKYAILDRAGRFKMEVVKAVIDSAINGKHWAERRDDLGKLIKVYEEDGLTDSVKATVTALQNEVDPRHWIDDIEKDWTSFLQKLACEMNVPAETVKDVLNPYLAATNLLVNSAWEYASLGLLSNELKMSVQLGIAANYANTIKRLFVEGKRRGWGIINPNNFLDMRSLELFAYRAVASKLIFGAEKVSSVKKKNSIAEMLINDSNGVKNGANFPTRLSLVKDSVAGKNQDASSKEFAATKVQKFFGSLFSFLLPLGGVNEEKEYQREGFGKVFIDESTEKAWKDFYPNADLEAIKEGNPSMADVYGDLDALAKQFALAPMDMLIDNGDVVATGWAIEGSRDFWMEQAQEAALDIEVSKEAKDWATVKIAKNTLAKNQKALELSEVADWIQEQKALGSFEVDMTNLVGRYVQNWAKELFPEEEFKKSSRYANVYEYVLEDGVKKFVCEDGNFTAEEIRANNKKPLFMGHISTSAKVDGKVSAVFGCNLIVSK